MLQESQNTCLKYVQRGKSIADFFINILKQLKLKYFSLCFNYQENSVNKFNFLAKNKFYKRVEVLDSLKALSSSRFKQYRIMFCGKRKQRTQSNIKFICCHCDSPAGDYTHVRCVEKYAMMIKDKADYKARHRDQYRGDHKHIKLVAVIIYVSNLTVTVTRRVNVFCVQHNE